MTNDNQSSACRVCGLIQSNPPWGKDGETPCFEICSCCGVEFGYEDSSLKGILTFRKKWLGKEAPWVDESEKPKGWSAELQLKNVPAEFIAPGVKG